MIFLPWLFQAVQFAANSTPYAFALEVAMHGANRDFLNLEKYLNDHLKSEGVSSSIVRSTLSSVSFYILHWCEYWSRLEVFCKL